LKASDGSPSALLDAACGITRETALYSAAAAGQHQCVAVLLNELGANATTGNHYAQTPAYIACSRGFPDCVSALSSSLAGLNAPNADGETPAFTAAEYGHCNCLEALKAAGADLTTPNSEGVTPAAVAKAEGKDDCVAFFTAA
jgi:CDK inhibitor PHO81